MPTFAAPDINPVACGQPRAGPQVVFKHAYLIFIVFSRFYVPSFCYVPTSNHSPTTTVVVGTANGTVPLKNLSDHKVYETCEASLTRKGRAPSQLLLCSQSQYIRSCRSNPKISPTKTFIRNGKDRGGKQASPFYNLPYDTESNGDRGKTIPPTALILSVIFFPPRVTLGSQ